MFDLIIDTIVEWVNITFLRKEKYLALINCAVKPVKDTLESLRALRTRTKYRLIHNGQICYLQAVLNDRYDNLLRRIYIEDGEVNGGTYVFTPGEELPLYLQTYIYSYDDWYLNGEYFVVVFPIDFDLELYKNEIRAIIDEYKLATKKYIIING